MAGSGNAPAILALTLLNSGHETWNHPPDHRPTHRRVRRRLGLLRRPVQPPHVPYGGRWSGRGWGRGFAALGTRQAVTVQGWGSALGVDPWGSAFTRWKNRLAIRGWKHRAAEHYWGLPGMASRICSMPGCPTIHDAATGSRCPTHAKAADRAHWDRTKGYNTRAHRVTFRLAVLQADPICRLCRVAVSTVADHYPKSREDLIQLGMNPNDPKHGRGLCESCHNTETARNQPGGWNTRD